MVLHIDSLNDAGAFLCGEHLFTIAISGSQPGAINRKSSAYSLNTRTLVLPLYSLLEDTATISSCGIGEQTFVITRLDGIVERFDLHQPPESIAHVFFEISNGQTVLIYIKSGTHFPLKVSRRLKRIIGRIDDMRIDLHGLVLGSNSSIGRLQIQI